MVLRRQGSLKAKVLEMLKGAGGLRSKVGALQTVIEHAEEKEWLQNVATNVVRKDCKFNFRSSCFGSCWARGEGGHVRLEFMNCNSETGELKAMDKLQESRFVKEEDCMRWFGSLRRRRACGI